MDKILKDLFDSKYTTTYARNLEANPNYIGSLFFPEETTNELKYKIVKGAAGAPVLANVHAFGVEADQASREGAYVDEGSIPAIKRKIPLDGDTLVQLNRQGLGDLEAVRDTIFGDLDNMVAAIKARVEKMKMDALANGKITITGDKIQAEVDYRVPAGHQEVLSGANLWSDPSSNPIEDIQRWANTVTSDTGVELSRALTSNTVASNMLQNSTVRQMIFGDNGGSRVITLNDVNQLLERMGLPTIATYNVRGRTQDNAGAYSSVRMFPESKFVMLPDGALGGQLLGPTEEALLDDNLEATDAPGIYAVTYKSSKDPVEIVTKAAATSIPTFERADEVFQATVI